MRKEEAVLSLLKSGELEIDDEGRIWRIAKRKGGLRGPNGEYLKGSRIYQCQRVRAEYPDKQGYLLVAVLIDGKRIAAGAHRIVWTHFNGPIPEGLTINHKDESGNKADNRPQNLELATYSEQRRHALEVLKVKRHHPKGSLNPKTKISETDAIKIRQLRSSGMMIKVIAMKYDMNAEAVSKICTGVTWKHV